MLMRHEEGTDTKLVEKYQVICVNSVVIFLHIVWLKASRILNE